MAKKRVSVKGKGVDLFFGGDGSKTSDESLDYSDLDPPDQKTLTSLDSSRENVQQSAPDGSDEFQTNRESATSSNMPVQPEPTDLISLDLLDSVWPEVTEKAAITNAFRYTNQELASLTDTVYELGKRHGMRITKQEVARLGLDIILADYQIRNNESILSEFVLRRKRQNM